MSQFLRLLSENDKAQALLTFCKYMRQGEANSSTFNVTPESFDVLPGKPFAYWVSDEVRNAFTRFNSLNTSGAEAWMGLSTGANEQWLRLYWEVLPETIVIHHMDRKPAAQWAYLSKGGEYSTYYPKIHVVLDWSKGGEKLADWKTAELEMGRITANNSKCWNRAKYFRPGLTWSARTSRGISLRAMPAECIFGAKGPAVLVTNDEPIDLLALLAVVNSRPFSILVGLQLAAADAAARSYEVGVIQKTPVPPLTATQRQQLACLARRSWSLKRTADSITETSHAFVLPAALRTRAGQYDLSIIAIELEEIQVEIDSIAFELYEFSDADRQVSNSSEEYDEVIKNDAKDVDEEETETEAPITDALLAWVVGVAFGRFDWRLATGERDLAPEPEPFDPLPAKSPGMLPDEVEPFHVNGGILVDDQGHPHDLVHIVEEVLDRVKMPVPDDVRRWLRKEFFAFHLQRYSKSRRKAPIYWPLATASGGYTLWVYYPSLTSQTLYTAINDFIEPKLKHVAGDVALLRSKGTVRTRDDEKQFEALQTFESELIDLRDTLLELAPTYKPNSDDGVQISAAPLRSLFRHKQWQKVLKDTWVKLEKGDHDWAHLTMNYWPERVREKCKTNKSLAIAHGQEALFVAPMKTSEGETT